MQLNNCDSVAVDSLFIFMLFYCECFISSPFVSDAVLSVVSSSAVILPRNYFKCVLVVMWMSVFCMFFPRSAVG